MSPLIANQLQRATGERVTALDGVAQQAADSAGRSRGPAVRNTDSRPATGNSVIPPIPDPDRIDLRHAAVAQGSRVNRRASK